MHKSSGEKISVSSKASVHAVLRVFFKGFCQLSQKQCAKMHVASAKSRHRALTAWLLLGLGGAGLCGTFRGHRGLLQGAGCRLLSSRDGIYWPVDGNHEPLMLVWCREAGGGGLGVKSTVMGTSTRSALLRRPCQAQRKCHVGGIPRKGAVQHPRVGRGQGQAGAEQLCPLQGLKTRGSRSCRQN